MPRRKIGYQKPKPRKYAFETYGEKDELEIASELAEIDNQIKALSTKSEALREELYALLEAKNDYHVKIPTGQWITRIPPKIVMRFSQAELKGKYPEVYEDCKIESEVRGFVVLAGYPVRGNGVPQEAVELLKSLENNESL